jgi:hypothetical protein
VGEVGETIQELEAFVRNVEEPSFSQGQLQGMENSKDQITSLRRKVCAHTDGLRITLLMTNT